MANEEYMPNVDSVGQRLAANSIALFSASSQFEAALHGLTAVYPGVVWVDPWPQSNHSTFAMRGVPSIAFSSTGRGRTGPLAGRRSALARSGAGR